MRLKLMTLNLHCFAEENIKENQKLIAETIIKNDVDIIFLQEVAQLETPENKLKKMISDDNYGLNINQIMSSKGYVYHYYYDPIKASFSIYQEGVGILSKYPLEQVKSTYISRSREYSDWKSRKVLSAVLDLRHKMIHLATTHFGWSDGYEVFEEQFDLATNYNDNAFMILAGDFNILPNSKEYKHIIDKGWIDLFGDDKDFFEKPTFRGDTVSKETESRLDYFMTNEKVNLINSKILFIEERVSDHFGVYAEIEV